MKIKEIVSALERFAPLPLQDGFDNAGLQIGFTDVEATGALLCLDVTEEIIDEAIANDCNIIISHHPLIFKGYKSITGRDYVERCIIKAIKHDIAIFAAHTNIDNAQRGVNFKIAEKIGLEKVQILDPKDGMLLKMVTFVPTTHVEHVKKSLFKAGCGSIGNYENCDFQVIGNSHYKAKKGANPFAGIVGKKHKEQEVRLEVVLPTYQKNAATKALLQVHPYEEPVFDFFALQNTWSQVGAGVIGELKEPESELEFLHRIKKIFEVECLRHNKLNGRLIRKVALCGGAGSFLLPKAITIGADVFITGEIKYHDFFGHEQEILMAEIGHYESEQYTIEIFKSIIGDRFPQLNVMTTRINTNPINFL
jgi:dinuclear metal center YbgI/SA1388 family protein